MPARGRISTAQWIGDTHKTCSKCGVMKPIGDYYIKANARGARKPTAACKECTIKKQLEWYYNKKREDG